MNTKYNLHTLIESRLNMQSTQRTLRDSYGIDTPTLDYLLSKTFADRLTLFSPFQKKNLFILLAGPFNWKSAASLIETEKNLI